ncbi:MAG TPA: glycosyltransferase [Solirubrobacterales bacterium]
MKTLSLVIPAYNEEARLPLLLEALSTTAEAAVANAGMTLLESLVVDDGSIDRSREVLIAATREDPRLKPVFAYEGNRGKGAAFAAGVQRAEGDYVLLADADLSTPIEELPKLTAAIEAGADLAIGSRAVAGAIVERGPLHRKVLGAGFNRTVRTLTGLSLRDTQCGFKLLPTEIAVSLLSNQLCPGFAFDVELLMRADREGMKIAEVPVLYLHDSRSRVRVASASIRMLRDVTALSYRLRIGGRRDGSARRLAAATADDPN